jgi:hypothetical protein
VPHTGVHVLGLTVIFNRSSLTLFAVFAFCDGYILHAQPEEIRSTFNITNDFSPEEEAQVREENKWCEEA